MQANATLSRSRVPAGVLLLVASLLVLTPAAADSALIDADEVREMQLAGEPFLLVDVRPSQQFDSGHIEGAVNMPAFSLRHRRFPADMLLVLYDDGLGSTEADEAASQLETGGHSNFRVLDGGLWSWDQKRFPAVRERGVTKTPLVTLITPEKLERLLGGGRSDAVTLIDIRSADKYREGRVPGAVNLEPTRLDGGLRDVSKQNIVIVYDDGSGADREAAEKLRRQGYSVRILYGGFEHWSRTGHEVSK
jgi:rhodanese-related sulfurtransferase